MHVVSPKPLNTHLVSLTSALIEIATPTSVPLLESPLVPKQHIKETPVT